MRTHIERGDPRKFRQSVFVGWWRMDQVTIGTGIASAIDLSGAGNTVAQGTGSAQPSLVPAAYRGRPAAHFEAASSQRLVKANTNPWGSGPYSAFTASKSGGAGGFPGLIASTTAAAGAIPIAECAANRGVIHSGTAAMSDAAVNTTSLEIQSTVRAAASVPVFRVNGVVAGLAGTSATLVDPGGTATLALGADEGLGRFWTGDMTEMVAYATDVSQSIVTRIEHRLGALYGAAA